MRVHADVAAVELVGRLLRVGVVQALHERPDEVVVKVVNDGDATDDEGDVVKGFPQEAFGVR